MSNKLMGSSVKNGIVLKLKTVFPEVSKVYKEAVSKVEFPHFFVHQLTLDITEDNYNFWFLNYFMAIRYRAVADITTLPTLQNDLDDIGLRLLTDLDCINLWDIEGEMNIKTKIINPRYEKVDGVLHYFCNVTVRATKDIPESALQEELTVDEKIITRKEL